LSAAIELKLTLLNVAAGTASPPPQAVNIKLVADSVPAKHLQDTAAGGFSTIFHSLKVQG
jgi:hypothetical protein